jgi:hypothetical protein
MATTTDISQLQTPPACVADFCIIPLGTPTASVSKEVAAVQRLLKKSGLEYSMHSAGTTLGMSTESEYRIPDPPVFRVADDKGCFTTDGEQKGPGTMS